MISRSSFLHWAFSGIVLVSFSVRAHVAVDEMADAAGKFVAALNSNQKAKAQFEFKSDERENWHFIPKSRNGLPIKEMTPPQRKLAHALLASGLSSHGYDKATNIMGLEPVLAELEGPARKIPRDPELYYFSIFGKPSAKGTWGWRVEGHHLAANFTIVNGELIAGTPSFMGSNPAEVLSGPRKGVRVLQEEEDLARGLVQALNSDQRKKAIFLEAAPKEIFTEAKKHIEPLDNLGIVAADLTKDQSTKLLALIKAYVERCRPDVAKDDLRKIEKAGLDKIYFGWAGGIEKGEGHYYRVQGPTFLLEYDNTQNNNNHVHAVWRDFKDDFGEDLLRQHYREVPHP